MTITDLYNNLSDIGVPIAYYEFKADAKNPAPKPPFIVYIETGSDHFMADNINYVKVEKFDIELYTAKKDPEMESKVEEKLKEIEITYQKMGDILIRSEDLFQVVYSISLI